MTKEITMSKAMEMRGCNCFEMARELEISIALVSKIKNGLSPISEETQRKFQKVFKGYKLVNNAIKWKEEYNSLKVRYDALELKYKQLEKDFNSVKKHFSKIADKVGV